jgi:elongation factor Ts
MYMTREDVPADVIEDHSAEFRAEALREGKPERIVDRIVAGRVEKFLSQVSLMEQPFVKDEDLTVLERMNRVTVRLGEKIVLRRFVRYQLGEGTE